MNGEGDVPAGLGGLGEEVTVEHGDRTRAWCLYQEAGGRCRRFESSGGGMDCSGGGYCVLEGMAQDKFMCENRVDPSCWDPF